MLNKLNDTTTLHWHGMHLPAVMDGGHISGGSPTAKTQEYNGTSWTELADLNTARNTLAGAGASNTSALAFGGIDSSGDTAKNEVWNGTSWSEDGDLGTGCFWFELW